MAVPAPAPMSLTAAELQAHPEFPHLWWPLKADKQGSATVAVGRGGPIKLAYEIHGHGPQHIVFIMGLGGLRNAWQRQVKHFGHDQADKYTCLIFDNRGIGDSDKPLMRYSTSEMARDTLDMLDEVGWTEDRQLHLVGISMGGMIAQEIATARPHRIASLTLVSTAAQIRNTTSFFENVKNRISLFMPQEINKRLAYSKAQLYAPSYLAQPDDVPAVVKAFPSCGDRVAASELRKRLDPKLYPKAGFMAQAVAAGWHKKSAAQLGDMAGRVGRHRICVMHGDLDRMIPFVHGGVLADGLDFGKKEGQEGVKRYWFKDVGHVAPVERRDEFNALLTECIERASRGKQ